MPPTESASNAPTGDGEGNVRAELVEAQRLLQMRQNKVSSVAMAGPAGSWEETDIAAEDRGGASGSDNGIDQEDMEGGQRDSRRQRFSSLLQELRQEASTRWENCTPCRAWRVHLAILPADVSSLE